MAQAMASMAGLRGSSQAVLEGSLPVSRLSNSGAARTALPRSSFSVRASGEAETSRRAMLGLAAAGIASISLVQSARAGATSSIKIGPPPPPSGGLPGTDNSDEARDLDLPLKERFYIQPLSPTEAAARAKESAKEIISVKSAIDKKAWPYVRDDLRLRSSYLRYDLKTIIDSKPSKEEKKQLKALTKDLFDTINLLDYAAKMKSPADAEKYYAATVSSLNGVISKLG